MLRRRELILILILSLLWSFTFLIIRMGVKETPPITLTQYRLFFAAGFLIILSLITRTSLKFERRYWGKLVLSSLFLNTLPFTLCAFGEMRIDSSTTGIIEGTMPLFTLLTGWLFFKQKRVDLLQLFAFVLALVGLVVVFVPSMMAGVIHEDVKGLSLLIAMSISFALGFNFSKTYLNEPPPIAVTTMQMLIAPFILFPFTLSIDGITIPTTKVASLLAILGVTSSMGWVVYFYIIKQTSASIASISSIIAPLFTILWGYLFLEEPLSLCKILGALLVVFSLSLLTKPAHNFLAKLKKPPNKKN